MKKGFTALAATIVLICAPVFVHAAPLASSDPTVVTATRELLATMKAREIVTSMLAQIEQQMHSLEVVGEGSAIVVKANLTPEQKAEEIKKANTRIKALNARTHAVISDPAFIDGLIEELVPLYAETYTLDEIRQLIAFYASPLGQKMQASAPPLMTRSMEISRWFLHTHLPITSVENNQGRATK